MSMDSTVHYMSFGPPHKNKLPYFVLEAVEAEVAVTCVPVAILELDWACEADNSETVRCRESCAGFHYAAHNLREFVP